MSVEPWQIKKYYRPRVLIGVSDLLDPPLPPMTLVCLTASELLLLRNVLDYCHRRSTFVVTYGTETYVTPDNPTWDVIEAIVADLEAKLMTDCSDILDRLDLIVAALEAVAPGLGDIDGTLSDLDGHLVTGLSTLDATLAGLGTGLSTINASLVSGLGNIDVTLASIVAALEANGESLACICQRLASIQQDPATTTIINYWEDQQGLSPTDPYPGEATPAEDEAACAISQLVWYFMYETQTEIVEPVQDKAVSVLLPLAMAVIASWCGATILLIPTGALLVLIWDLIEVWVQGRFAQVTNAIYNNKDELICAAYDVLRVSGTLQQASSAMADVINELPELSPLDKVTLRALCAPWVFSRMGLAWTNQTPWATGRVVPGYCATNCPEQPLCGSDWCAVPYTGDEIIMDHTAGAYWLTGCWPQDVPDAKRTAGVFFEVLEHTGNCQLKRMNGVSAGCGQPATLWNNTSDSLQPGWYFSFKTFEFNDQECHTQIRPDSTQLPSGHLGTDGPVTAGTAFQMGWNCTGYARIAIRYIVYNGNTYP